MNILTTSVEHDVNKTDMFAIRNMVTVGNSQSKHIINGAKEWIYTPRGYDKKL